MDRSYLSQPKVVAASRDFVAIRLATYEDEDEARILKSFFTGRGGSLKNSLFALIRPDGRTLLAPAGRSPRRQFDGPDDLAERMSRLRRGFGESQGQRPVPLFTRPRLALNVAACDQSLLLMVVGSEAGAIASALRRMRPAAWSERLSGHVQYSRWPGTGHSPAIDGLDPSSPAGLYLVKPNSFGSTGRVIRRFSLETSGQDLALALSRIVEATSFKTMDIRDHVRLAQRQGISWQSVVPVTDPGALQARGRRRGRGSRR